VLLWIAAGALALALPLPCALGEVSPSPEKTAAWKRALAAFTRTRRSPNFVERAQAAKALGAAVPRSAHLHAARLLVALLNEEIDRSTAAEENVRLEVIDAVVSALRLLDGEKAVDWLVRSAQSRRLPWRVRFHIIEGLAAKPQGPACEALKALLGTGKAFLGIPAAGRLGETGGPDATDSLGRGLEAAPWQVRIACVGALRRLVARHPGEKFRAAEALVCALEKADGRCGRVEREILASLRRITGRDAGPAAGDWRNWLCRAKRGVIEEGDPLTRPWVPRYHGMEIWSDRVVFVLDVTGSMEDPAPSYAIHSGVQTGPSRFPREAAGPVRTDKEREHLGKLVRLWDKNRKRKVRTKMDAEKKELISALAQLPPRTRFSLVFYAGTPRPWKRELVPATFKNRIDAVEAVENVSPYGGTNIYDALLAAFDIRSGDERKKKRKPLSGPRRTIANLAGPVDEVFLLTDGRPNAGRVKDPARIREEIRKLNRVRCIRINTIAVGIHGMGVSPVNVDFMLKLALENRGRFVHVE
jgi:hypothetical protein